RPVHYAILPELAESPSQLTAANSVSSSLEGLGILIGPLSITPLVLLGGTPLVPAVYSVVLVATAMACRSLRTDRVASVVVAGEAGGIVGDTLDAARAVLADPPAATLTILGGSQYVVIGLLDVFWAILAIELLGEGEHVAGLLASAFGLGGLLGAAATAILVGRRRLTPPIVTSLAGAGLAIAAVAWAPALAPAALLLAVAGAARSFFDVAARTLLQRSLDREVIARVFGLQEGLIMLGLAIGSALAPVLVAAFGPEGALVAMGVLIPVVAAASFVPLARLDRRAVLVDEGVRSMLRSIAIFEPLPEFELEDVARLLIPVTATTGEVLIREGEPGDRFYVVAAGEVAVRSSDREVARIGPGGYFGEIALLRDVPRTATVVAMSDVSLLALERDDFLSAVSGGRRLSHLADLEIDRRLGELRPEVPSQDRNTSS
ncbi:MAG TPA: cyclic nucleotide-binding domain-containing protein, partial [Actinomycetota bacterium]